MLHARPVTSIGFVGPLHTEIAVLTHSFSCRWQGQAQAAEAQAELPAAEPGRPLRRTRGLWGAAGVRRPGGPETLTVPPAVPLGRPPAAVEGGSTGGGASMSGGGGANAGSGSADAASPTASTSMADLTRVLHVSNPAHAVPCLNCFRLQECSRRETCEEWMPAGMALLSSCAWHALTLAWPDLVVDCEYVFRCTGMPTMVLSGVVLAVLRPYQVKLSSFFFVFAFSSFHHLAPSAR